MLPAWWGWELCSPVCNPAEEKGPGATVGWAARVPTTVRERAVSPGLERSEKRSEFFVLFYNGRGTSIGTEVFACSVLQRRQTTMQGAEARMVRVHANVHRKA